MVISATADGTASSPGTTAEWTRSSLATHLLSVVGKNARGADGTVPDALVNIVLASFEYVYTCHDWEFRSDSTSIAAVMTLTDGATYWSITDTYDDFAKLMLNKLEETSGKGSIIITTKLNRFQAVKDRWMASGSMGEGQPEIGYIVQHNSGKRVLLAPESNGAYVYPFPYIRKAPSLGLTDVPQWDDFAFGLWALHAKCEAQKAFVGGDDWKTTWRHFASVRDSIISENDEEHTDNTAELYDPYGDLRVLGNGNGVIG